MAVGYSRARVCGRQLPCQLASSYAYPVSSWSGGVPSLGTLWLPTIHRGPPWFDWTCSSGPPPFGCVRLGTSIAKKPTRQNTLRSSTTSAYSLTSLPARPGCSLFSHPIFSYSVARVIRDILQPDTGQRYAPNGVLAESVYGPWRMSLHNPPRRPGPASANRLGRSVGHGEGRSRRERVLGGFMAPHV